MLDNGDILYEYNDMGAREIDVLGNVVREWAGRLELGRLATDEYGRTIAGPNAIPVDTDSMHHEIHPMPDGNLITLSTELNQVSGFTKPMCGETPTSSRHLSAHLGRDRRFEPDTGVVVLSGTSPTTSIRSEPCGLRHLPLGPRVRRAGLHVPASAM
jgi:hypothetical protein